MFKNILPMILKSSVRKYPDKKILLVSLQKSGTHLIKNVLAEAGFEAEEVGKNCSIENFKGLENNHYLVSHFTPSDDIQMALEEGLKDIHVIFNYRDPRDVLVSWFHWLHPNNKKTMHSHMRYMQKVYSHFSDAELMKIFITNEKFRKVEYNPIEAYRFARVLLYHPAVLKVRFEDLVGPKGGGNSDKQIKTIKSIYRYLSVNNIDPNAVANKIYSEDSVTFRMGKIEGYKNNMTKDQLNLFNQHHGDILHQYGYV